MDKILLMLMAVITIIISLEYIFYQYEYSTLESEFKRHDNFVFYCQVDTDGELSAFTECL